MKIASVAVVLVMAAQAWAQVSIEQWGASERASHPKTVQIEGEGDGPTTIRVDLSALPAGAKVLHAHLLASREQPWGNQDEANVRIEIAAKGGKPLGLVGPYFDRFDATEAVRAAAAAKAPLELTAKNFFKWRREATQLEIAFEGKGQANAPPAVAGLKAFHRAGQTFLTWADPADPFDDKPVTYGQYRDALDKLEQERQVRYRVYRHSQPITPANLPQTQFVGEVGPMSQYNVHGRSVDELIAQVRRQAIDDLNLAKKLARDGFGRYNPDMPEMAQVAVRRLAIEDGKPLPPKTGLFVQQAAAAGKAFYAVVAMADGTANCAEVSGVDVVETVGAGLPVLQGPAQVTVFFDYPGQRMQYVQWAGPPLANLPGQYYNWGVFVPRDYAKADRKRLAVYFHDMQQRYLKPPWPHRRDTVLLSPHDYPFRSFGYGYHEALGTLRAFDQGQVRPFFARRVDAMLDWAVANFKADAGSLSCGGAGYWSGTAALQYGLRRPGRIAYVQADSNFDPDPKSLPAAIDKEGRTARPLTEAVWGKSEWNVQAEGGKGVWDEMDLPAYVRASKATMPFLSLGAGSQHQTWKAEAELMKAYMETRNGFMAEFFWGSTAHIHLPVTAESGDLPFEPRTDQPVLACWPKGTGITKDFYEKYFVSGVRGYTSGDRFNTRPRWRCDDVVDEADKLELTIFSGNVVYAGSETVETTVRNMKNFKPAAGETVNWKAGTGDKAQSGQAKVDEQGRIVIPSLTFGGPARLVVTKGKPE